MRDKIQDIILGIYGLVAVAPVLLKLTGVIDWPWLLLTAPFWVALAIVVLVIVALYAFRLCCLIYREIKRRNSNKW